MLSRPRSGWVSPSVARPPQMLTSTKSQQITAVESLNVVRNLLSTGLSCITYLR